MTYHEHTDIKYARHLRQNAPEAFSAFNELDNAALRSEDNEISVKNAELMAVAVALTTQCAYCIEIHTKAAFKAGASQKELAETVMIASALRAGGAFAHGFMAMKFYEQESAATTAAA